MERVVGHVMERVMGTAYRTKVLLVEDESLIAELVTEVLEEHGFDVCAVATVQTAKLFSRRGVPETDARARLCF